MTPAALTFLRLLDAALREANPEPWTDSATDWDEVFALAQRHRVTGLLLNTAVAMDPSPPEPLLSLWQDQAMRTLLQQTQYVGLLGSVLEAFDQAGLRPVVLKGVAIKPLYADPDMRTMSDADLLISPEEFAAGCALLAEYGFEKNEQDSTESVFECDHPVGLRVELHQRLFDKKRSGFLAKLDEEALFPATAARREPVYGGEAYVFPPMEHALFMLLHMAKHMIVTGFGLRQVADFSLFVKRYDEEIGWPEFWRIVRMLDLTRFTGALLTLCHTWLSLPLGHWAQTLPIAMDSEAAECLLEDLLEAGVFGKSSQERTRSAAVVYRSFDSDQAGEEGAFRRLLRAVFVRPDELKSPYLYAKRCPVLLPVAWAHRLGSFVFKKGRGAGSEAAEGMRIGQERLQLLNKLGMRE